MPPAHPVLRLSTRSSIGTRLGVPYPRGRLFPPFSLRAFTLDGDPLDLAVQTRTTSSWPDGSVKWLLVYVAPFTEQQRAPDAIELRDVRAVPQDCMRVVTGPGSVEVDSGTARLVFAAGGDDLLRSVRSADGGEWLDGGVRLVFRGRAGEGGPAMVRSVRVAEVGSVRTVVESEGGFGDAGPVEFLARWSVYAGSAFATLDLRVRNIRPAAHPGGIWDLGDPGSVLIDELSLVARPGFPVERRAHQVAPDSAPTDADASAWSVYQDSSGGEHWNSPNHVEADGSLGVAFRGYRIEGGPSASVPVVKGRAQPSLAVSGHRSALGCALRDFWQNFPKGLAWTGGELRLGLFPRERGRAVELQGGEQKRHHIAWAFWYAQAVDLDALQRTVSPDEPAVDPSWVESTGAVPGLVVDLSGEPAWTDYVRSIVDGPRSFSERREAIDEYGWRNFGDLWADHEAVNHRGPEPFVSHYNNQYDFVWAAGLHALRTADRRWARLARECADHTVDIDVYHTTGDRPAYNGGLFWHTDHYLPARTATHRTYSRANGPAGGYGGGPANEHNYATGLLLHYWRTGDPDALETVRCLADWVVAMDDGTVALSGLIDGGPTGLASKTVHAWYHGPGRGVGNSICTLLDAYLACNQRAYLDKAEELIRRCVHPRDDIASRGLEDIESRWSYLVFLQALGRYLELKLGYRERDYMFHYARESLLHYSVWMLEHEVPYKEVLHRVELPTESWPAHDIRKCHVFHLAARFDDRGMADRFRERAAFFHDRCLGDLGTFSTRHLTRPLVLLAAYGHVHAFYSALRPIEESERKAWRHIHDFGVPRPFELPRNRMAAALRARMRSLRSEIARLVRDRLGATGGRRRVPKAQR